MQEQRSKAPTLRARFACDSYLSVGILNEGIELFAITSATINTDVVESLAASVTLHLFAITPSRSRRADSQGFRIFSSVLEC
jgi:hypothetical protein